LQKTLHLRNSMVNEYFVLAVREGNHPTILPICSCASDNNDFYSWLVVELCVEQGEHFDCLPSSDREMTLVSTTSVWETNLVPNQALTQSSPLHPLYSLK
jgi:hypothetical protein